MTDAIARGGPGLCASIGDSVLVYRRTADGRLVETLAFDAKHSQEPAERSEFRYDRDGRLIQKTVRGTDHTFDATIDLWYDKAGRVIRRREHHEDQRFWGGDVNITYAWNGKALPGVLGHFMPPDVDDLTEPLAYALAFSGTVHEARYYDGSPAPQPEREYTHTYDDRGRLVRIQSTGWNDPSRDDTLEWDADNQLVAYRASLEVTQYEWRDHRPVATRHVDRSGVLHGRFEQHYDATGRPSELVRFDPPGTTTERLTSATIDHERGELVTTTVQEDVPPSRIIRTFRYDCGPPAMPK